jgi:hypothetical protein
MKLFYTSEGTLHSIHDELPRPDNYVRTDLAAVGSIQIDDIPDNEWLIAQLRTAQTVMHEWSKYRIKDGVLTYEGASVKIAK